MAGKNIRVGIIGAGGIAQGAHIPGYLNAKGAEIVSVADPKEGRAQQAADKFGIPHAYNSAEELLKAGGIDAVSICSPNAFHAPQTIAALKAGYHVLCEKPMAISVRDAENMIKTANDTGKTLMIGMTSRFRPDTQILKKYADDGLLGDIYYFKAGWLRRNGIPGYGSWFTNKKLAGGGCLLDIGVHYLDLAMWIAGFPKPVSVTGMTYAEFGPRGLALGGWGMDIDKESTQPFDVDDLATAFIRFEDGQVLTLEVSWAAHVGDHGENYLRFLGTKGGAEMSSHNGEEFPIRYFGESFGASYDSKVYASPGSNTHWVEIQHFIDVLRGDAELAIKHEEALTIAKILDAIDKSAKSRNTVKIA